MKTTTFLWGWQDHQQSPDPSMDRPRMARLMRSWRRSATQGSRNFDFKCIERKPGEHVYRVSTTGYRVQDVAHFTIRRTS